MSEKQRADVALVERGLCESRTKAQVSIMENICIRRYEPPFF